MSSSDILDSEVVNNQSEGDRSCGVRPQRRCVAARSVSVLFQVGLEAIACKFVVDDFGVKYVGRRHLDHLINALRDHYKITVELAGNRYLGLTIDWNYSQGYVDI